MSLLSDSCQPPLSFIRSEAGKSEDLPPPSLSPRLLPHRFPHRPFPHLSIMDTIMAKGAEGSTAGGGTSRRMASIRGAMDEPGGACPPGGSSLRHQPCLAVGGEGQSGQGG